MGNCISLHTTTNSSSSSAIKLGSVQFEPLVIRPQSASPIPQQVSNFRDLSYGEEMFFDSYGYLESDCEDYFSINGDFTPSRGNTPIHPNSIIESPRPEKTIHMDNAAENCIAESSPADMKKLFELFNKSFNSSEAQSKTIESIVPNYSCSTEATPNGDWYSKKEKSGQSAQCCLPVPSFVRSMSFSERKKKLSSNNTQE